MSVIPSLPPTGLICAGCGFEAPPSRPTVCPHCGDKVWERAASDGVAAQPVLHPLNLLTFLSGCPADIDCLGRDTGHSRCEILAAGKALMRHGIKVVIERSGPRGKSLTVTLDHRTDELAQSFWDEHLE